MYSVNGVPLDNEEMGWRFRAPSQPLSGLSRERTTLSAAGRDGVISVPGATFGAVGLSLMVQTPRAQHEALVALFAEDGVLSLTDTPTRQARFEFLASSPAGRGNADEVIDVTCTIRLIDATWRDVDVATFTAALSAASVPLSCWPAHPSGVLSQVRNLFTNPNFVATAGSVEVWRNRALDPVPDVSKWQAQWGTGGAGNFTTGSVGPGGSVMALMEWTTAPTSPASEAWRQRMLINNTAALTIPVTAGEQISMSVPVAATGGISTAGINVDWFVGTTYLSSVALSAVGVSTNPAAPTMLTYTTPVVPATVTGMRISVTSPNALASAGSKLWVGSLMVGPGPRFTGAGMETPDPDLTPAWSGPVNNSACVLNGVALASMGFIGASTRAFKSALAGRPAIRVMRVAAGGDPQALTAGITAATLTGMISIARATTVAGRAQASVARIQDVGVPYGNTELIPSSMINSAAVGVWMPAVKTYTGRGDGLLQMMAPDQVGESFYYSKAGLFTGVYTGMFIPDPATTSRLVVDAWDGAVEGSSVTRTTYESWDGGLSAPVQDAIVRVKGAVTGLTITDASGAWLSFPTIPAGQWLRVEGRRAFLTATDVWTGGTDVSGDLRQGGPRRRFEITPKRGASPDARAGQLTVATGSRTGAVIEVRGRGAYLQAER